MDEEKITDSEWLRLQRLEHDRRRWLWSRIKQLASWIVGSLTAMWAGADALGKLIDWLHRR